MCLSSLYPSIEPTYYIIFGVLSQALRPVLTGYEGFSIREAEAEPAPIPQMRNRSPKAAVKELNWLSQKPDINPINTFGDELDP